MPTDPIFLSGWGRSGTTLLQVMLDSHPNIAMGSEVPILPDEPVRMMRRGDNRRLAVRAGIDKTTQSRLLAHVHRTEGCGRNVLYAFGNYLAQEKGALRWGWKTMANDPAQFREHFPRAVFVHVVRDGRDTYASQMPFDWRPATPKDAAADWMNVNARAEEIGALVVRYEDLVEHPAAEMSRVMHHLGEPWDDRVLAHHEQRHAFFDATAVHHPSREAAMLPVYRDSVGRWERDNYRDLVEQFEDLAQHDLLRYRYQLSSPVPPA